MTNNIFPHLRDTVEREIHLTTNYETVTVELAIFDLYVLSQCLTVALDKLEPYQADQINTIVRLLMEISEPMKDYEEAIKAALLHCGALGDEN